MAHSPDPLLAPARALLRAHRFAEALAAADAVDAALADAGRAPGDPARVEAALLAIDALAHTDAPQGRARAARLAELDQPELPRVLRAEILLRSVRAAGDPDGVGAQVAAALALAAGHPEVEAALHLEDARLALDVRDGARLDRAIARADAARADVADPSARWETADGLAHCELRAGRADRAVARFEEAAATAREAGDALAEAHTRLRLMRIDRWPDDAEVDRVRAALEAHGDAAGVALLELLRAIREAESGHLSQADARMAQVVGRLPDFATRPTAAVLAFCLGRDADAAEHLARAPAEIRSPSAALGLRLVADTLAGGLRAETRRSLVTTPTRHMTGAAALAAADRLAGRAGTDVLRLLEHAGRIEACRARVAARLAGPTGPIPCGPFDLVAPIGRGGAASVWRALDAGGREVAVKVVRDAREPAAVAALQRETRLVAAMSHPHVVPILDLGETGLALEAATRDGVPAGAPWVAMPLAGGSLDGLVGTLGWDSVLAVLRAVLSALAHTHARGVLHLDVKPPNLLCADPARPGSTLWLADFGVARGGDGGEGEVRGGTPAYMPPEQWRGRRSDLGPWSDLYAVGGLATALVAGAPPFGSRGTDRLRRAHLGDEPPPLQPRSPVPRGLDAWIRALLDKDPEGRPGTAAAALEGLDALGAPEEVAPVAASASAREDTWHTLDARDPTEETPVVPAVPAARPRGLPTDWRSVPAPPAPPPPSAALLSLRHPRVVGHEAQRDALWGALGRVLATRRPEVVHLLGPEGGGSRALAAWVGHTAAETGSVRVVATTPGRDLLASALASVGLEAGASRPDRVRAALRRHARALDPAAQDAVCSAIEGSPGARGDAARDVLAGMAAQGPLYLSTGVHLGPADLEVLARLPAGAPILAVVATRTGDADELPAFSAAMRRARATEVTLGPLRDDEVEGALVSLLPLSVDARRRIADAAEGLVGHAVTLSRRAVADGQLALGADGVFTLEDRWSPSFDLDRWRERAAAERAAIGPAVETLAALGALGRATVAEWGAVCAALDLPDPGPWRERWLRRALVSEAADRVRLAHPGLAAALPAPPGAHPAAAAALERLGAEGRQARIGEHLLAAGQALAALPRLLAGAEEARALGRHAELRVLRRARAAATAGGVPPGDPRWRDLEEAEIKALDASGDRRGAHEALARYLGRREAGGEPPDPMVLVIGARARAHLGDPAGAAALYRQAADRAAPGGRALILVELGTLLLSDPGTAAEGTRVLASAAELDAGARVEAAYARGIAAIAQGDLAAARPALEEATGGPPARALTAWIALGDLARWSGDLATAERCCDAAAAIVAGGQPGAALVQLNRMLVALGAGDLDRARALLPTCDEPGNPRTSAPTERAIRAIVSLLAPGAPSRADVARALRDARVEVDVRWAGERVAAWLEADTAAWLRARVAAFPAPPR